MFESMSQHVACPHVQNHVELMVLGDHTYYEQSSQCSGDTQQHQLTSLLLHVALQ